MAGSKKSKPTALVWTKRGSKQAPYRTGLIVKNGNEIIVKIGGDTFHAKSIKGAKEIIDVYIDVRVRLGKSIQD